MLCVLTRCVLYVLCAMLSVLFCVQALFLLYMCTLGVLCVYSLRTELFRTLLVLCVICAAEAVSYEGLLSQGHP